MAEIRKCKCGRNVAPGALKYCVYCQADKIKQDRKKSAYTYKAKLRQLDQVRECKRCNQVKKHHKSYSVCVDCYNQKCQSKNAEKRPEDIIFLSLISKARFSNHAKSNKIRKSTIKESEELWRKKTEIQ